MSNAKLNACRGDDLAVRWKQATARKQYGAVSSEQREVEAEGSSLIPELEMLRFN